MENSLVIQKAGGDAWEKRFGDIPETLVTKVTERYANVPVQDIVFSCMQGDLDNLMMGNLPRSFSVEDLSPEEAEWFANQQNRVNNPSEWERADIAA